nr:hypothetical protein [Candidatus Njordarchaeota archaeon]
MKLSKLKEKLGLKKTDTASGEGESEEPLQKEEKRFPQTEGSTATCGSSESLDLTEKLKAAFHEKPKEDKEHERRKELDHEIRDFRKSFRRDVKNGVRQISGEVATEVKHTITTIKVVAKKRKGRDDDQASTSQASDSATGF